MCERNCFLVFICMITFEYLFLRSKTLLSTRELHHITRVHVRNHDMIQQMTWSRERLEEEAAGIGEFCSTHHDELTCDILDVLRKLDVVNKQILIIDDDGDPWIELLCLHLGATHITSVTNFISEHPYIMTTTYLHTLQEKYDITIASYSFLDSNPYTVKYTIGMLKRYTKVGGRIVFGIPHGEYPDTSLHPDMKVITF